MSSKLQLDVRHLNRWWRHLVNAYEVRQAWCLLQVKLCDPCLSALKRFVLYHARRYTSARCFTLLYFIVKWRYATNVPAAHPRSATVDAASRFRHRSSSAKTAHISAVELNDTHVAWSTSQQEPFACGEDELTVPTVGRCALSNDIPGQIRGRMCVAEW